MIKLRVCDYAIINNAKQIYITQKNNFFAYFFEKNLLYLHCYYDTNKKSNLKNLLIIR